MGWFDSDNKEKTQAPATQGVPAQAAPAAPRQTAKSSGPTTSGSTLGKRVLITGTIVSEEDLEIFGRVEGTIHARETLSIARHAELKAVLHGRRVMLDGSLEGDIHASELVVLGEASMVRGDIHTPALQIREGALFQGAVKMKAPASPAVSKGTARQTPAGSATSKPKAATPPTAQKGSEVAKEARQPTAASSTAGR